MIVYLIDRRAPSAPQPDSLDALMRHADDFEQGWRRVLSALPGHGDAQVLLVESNDSVGSVIDRTITAVRTANTIWLLRILAHGSPGEIRLGKGVRMANAALFARLADYMTSSGLGVEIHGCHVAGSPQGMRLLQRFANAVRMSVVASPAMQYADNRFRIEGSASRAEPQGRRGH